MITVQKTVFPKIWQGSKCYIIGGGPSLRRMDLTPIHDQHVIGTNNAYQLGNWVDVVFFCDTQWYRYHRVKLRQFPGLKVHCMMLGASRDEQLKQATINDSIHYLGRGKRFGIEEKPGFISWNLNIGANAINLAHIFGATTIVLLGFDMKKNKVVKDDPQSYLYQSNWHDDHLRMKGHHPDQIRRGVNKQLRKDDKGPYEGFLKAFPAIKRDADRLGITILNATPDSAISPDIFPNVNLVDTL